MKTSNDNTQFEAGRTAHREGKTYDSNPHAKGSRDWYDWNNGMRQGGLDDDFARQLKPARRSFF